MRLRLLTLLLGAAILQMTSGCAHLLSTEADKDKARLHLQLAADHFNGRDYNKAIEATQQALKLDPSMAAAYNHLALIYMETKRFLKSEEAFKKALQLQPDYPEVLNNMGVMYNRQEQFQRAMGFFEQAINSDKYLTPENALTNLGYSWYRMGDLTKAKAYHQKALDVAPQFCLAHKNMGDVYAKEKAFPKAADYFQKAVTYCPLYQESQYKLGLVMMKLGQRNVARTQLEKLVERHKTGPYVERSNEVLKFLR